MVDHVADDFDRADNASSLGSTSVGSVTWVPLSGGGWSGTWGISSNQAYLAAITGFSAAIVPTATPEGKVAADITSTSFLPGGGFAGVAGRVVDNLNWWSFDLTDNNVRLTRMVAGTHIIVWSSSPSSDTPGTYRLELTCRGDDLECRVDGSLVHTETSTIHNTGTGFGLLGADYVHSNLARWDDFDLELPQEASATFNGSGSFTAEAAHVVYPQSLVRDRAILGPHVDPDPAVCYPAPVVRARVASGPVAPNNPVLITPITPMSVETRRRVVGPWMPEPTSDPDIPVVEIPSIGPGFYVDARLIVDHDTDHITAASCQPRMNQQGSGQFTCREAPALGQTVAFTVAGQRQMTGIVTEYEAHEVAPGEEHDQNFDVTCVSRISEWSHVVVLPDFGAQDINRLGPPNQDIRVFDWTMNGLGNEQFGESAATIIPSTSVDMIVAQEAFKHPIPDVWPDADARWMWVTDPLAAAPTGWCLFRVVTPARWAGMSVDFWLAASSYADLWVDGVPVATCDQPYVSQKIRLNIDTDWHLVTIKAYNANGGYPGVLFSMMPVEEATSGYYGQAIMNSRSGWKSVAYPDRKRTFISTPGQVMKRLLYEANKRGATSVAGWDVSFGNLFDSAGRPWDRKEAIQVDVGKTYYDTLLQLAEDIVDWAEDPGSKLLHMWKKGEGSGRTTLVPWTDGVDLDARDVAAVAR